MLKYKTVETIALAYLQKFAMNLGEKSNNNNQLSFRSNMILESHGLTRRGKNPVFIE